MGTKLELVHLRLWVGLLLERVAEGGYFDRMHREVAMVVWPWFSPDGKPVSILYIYKGAYKDKNWHSKFQLFVNPGIKE